MVTDRFSNAFYYAFKMAEKKSFEYYVTDLLSDALGRDKSSKLYISLQKELKLVTEIHCYITGSLDNGLLIIEGKIAPGETFEKIDSEIWKVLEELKNKLLSDSDLERIKNKISTSKEFQEQGLLNRAMNLCLYELLGDANGVNEEASLYESITADHIHTIANEILISENCSLLKIKAIQE